ncbi:S53 family peptidase [Sorangium sp. So ce542]|uniref:S53 family peptidase n=1 Tax=Sorangium sp. So ce542 TaxID=3133316 RepID=UPI003F605966
MTNTNLTDLGPVAENQIIRIVVLLSSLSGDKRDEARRALEVEEGAPSAPDAGALRRLHGASDESFAAVVRFASAHGLRVEGRRELPADVTLSGTAHDMRRAFGVELRRVSDGDGQYLAPRGEIRLPPEFADYVVGILGLDTRPVARSLHKLTAGGAPAPRDTLLSFDSPDARRARFTALDLAKLYNFPQGLDGSGQKVGIILPGGGLPVKVLDRYFDRLGLKVPKIEIIEVDGAKNEPSSLEEIRDFIVQVGLGRPSRPLSAEERSRRAAAETIEASWDMRFTMEIMMDVEILGAVANGAEIRVYRTPEDVKGIYNAIMQAVDDGVTILSNSWGAAEGDLVGWRHKIERALEFAVGEKGVTVLFASGDRGSTPSGFEEDESKLQPCYPASSPWVVACGGTAIELARSRLQAEVVWNERAMGQHLASSGGFSHYFKRPSWQTGVKNRMRGVPDISANAAVKSGVWLWFGEVSATSFGTSAAVQLLAGLTARIYQGLGFSVPLLNAVLYRPEVREAMRPITEGDNFIRRGVDAYKASAGWNACTGLGRPDGERLLKALQDHFKATRG